ncbi:MAG: shikimate kinase [Oscillospiraceae bacterium]|nr:shikimate kinase [Oscillospiraceae bacterium]
MIEYGLIGEKLGHSFSKMIHEKLADYTYDLCPLAKDELDGFMQKKEFKAINVTIPYKKAVLPYLDEIDESAKKIGAVNTVVNQNGKLKGYNTDFTGFLYSVKSHGVDFQGKDILLLGNGGAAQAVKAVIHHLGAERTIIADMKASDENGEHVIAFSDIPDYYDVDIIINATPCGMYPNVDDCLLDLRNFTACQAVFDVIYNPLKTRLLKQAEEMGMTAVNGLEMLVAQAKYAVEHFLSTTIDDSRIGEIQRELTEDLSNIVLIGMPSCGKTFVGTELQNYVDKTLVDIDALIVERSGMEIREIFEQFGEPYFRKLESEVIADVAKKNRQIIATGGGAIKNPENILRLKQNGVVVFIDRELNKLLSTHDRPLSSSKEAVAELYKQRYPLYLSYGDVRVENNYDEDTSSQEDIDQLMGDILEGYREIIGNQWT